MKLAAKSNHQPARPTAVDLFSGAGGLSLGCEQAGLDVLASVEYDPICSAVHRFNFPRTEAICCDAATLTAKRITDAAHRGWTAHGRAGEWSGKLDVVVGGPPCQGFSVMGKRAFDDPRNQLVFSFARLVGTLKPRYFLMENVPGMSSVRAGEAPEAPRLLDLLLEDFEGYGYEVLAPRTLNAYNFGVPQDRKRMLLVGWRAGETPIAYPTRRTLGRTRTGVKERTGGDDLTLPLCPSVWDAIGDLPDLDAFEESANGDEVSPSQAHMRELINQASSFSRALQELERDTDDLSYPRVWDRKILTSSYRTVHAHEVVERYRATAEGSTEEVSRFFRLHREGASSTLRAGTHYDRGSFNAPRPIHPTLPRVISVREAARLHSFPDWFRFHWTKWHGFREVGNSLPPLLGRAVASVIVGAVGEQPGPPTRDVELGARELLYLKNEVAARRFAPDYSRIPRNALRKRRLTSAKAA